MDPLTAAFGLACIGVGGGAGYWLKKADERLQRLSETAVVLQEGQAAHFSHLNTEVNTLQQRLSHMTGLVEALRATHPEIDGALLSIRSLSNMKIRRELNKKYLAQTLLKHLKRSSHQYQLNPK